MSSTFNPSVRKPLRNRSLASGVLRNRFPLGETRETKLGEICQSARERFPFYFKLPWDDPIALLKWRIYARRRCAKDPVFRALIWEMCRLDVAFFAVTFAFVFEPRPVARRLPFNLWTDQVSLLSWFTEIFGERSGAVNKTRGIGLSWLVALFIFHAWLFYPECKIAVLTKDKDLLDGPDCNSLIGKFQYLFDHLPIWAKFTKSGGTKLYRVGEKHTFINTENAAVIQGFVSTSTKLRQLRFTMIFADEFAFYDRTDQEEWVVSAGGCTNCMLMVSTWNDFDDMFHHIMFEEESSLLRMNAFWWNNYERWRGAYKFEVGRVVFVDKEYRHPNDYKFGEPDVIEEGMLRSPWVDAELLQPGKKKNILKALRDIYGMAVCQHTNRFFDANTQKAVKASVCDPDRQGTLDVSTGEVIILPTNKSDIRLWGNVPEDDRGPYTLFCDLAHGVEAAFSVAVALDRVGDQVLEYGRNDISITEFARNVVYISRWLAGDNGDGWVLVDFESNAMPKAFMAELDRLMYGNTHFSDFKNTKALKPGEVSKYAGTRNTDGGFANFRELERAIMAMDTRIKSARVANDIRRCSKDEEKGGQPKFPKGHKDGHGDFLYAYGGAWWRARSTASVDNRVQLGERYSQSAAILEPATLWSDTWN